MNEMIGTSKQGYIGTAAQPAPQPNQSSALLNGIMERSARLNVLAEQLEALADRVVGSEPQSPKTGDNGVRPQPHHVAGRLDMCVEGVDYIGNRINNALQRLERFA